MWADLQALHSLARYIRGRYTRRQLLRREARRLQPLVDYVPSGHGPNLRQRTSRIDVKRAAASARLLLRLEEQFVKDDNYPSRP